MSSILTNTSAMVALQTLRSINNNLEMTQGEIATGKSVASAKDNSAVWAISKVMESDVAGFKAISDSLSLGESTVAVATQASETVTDLLTEIKSKIVASQEDNVDRDKIQTDIDALKDQISSVVGAAQFNGLNLVKGTEDVNVLSSLDRSSTGVTASNITVARQDLSTDTGTYEITGTSLTPNATVSDTGANALNDDGNNAQITFNTAAYGTAADAATITVGNVALSFEGDTGLTQDDAAAFFEGAINALGLEGISATSAGAVLTINSTIAFEDTSVTVSGLGGNAAGTEITDLNGAAVNLTTGDIAERAENITFSTTAAVNEGDGYRVTFGGDTFTYVAGPSETFEDVANGLKAAIDGTGVDGITTQVVTDETTGAAVLKIDNASTTDMTLAAIGNAGGEASGGLFGLDGIDVTTEAGANSALDNIETMIQTSIDAAAQFGSVQGRIEIQNEFVINLQDALKAGIGSMVDADMEEASARLQALQVQQQLGTQALSIANQAPQSILALFR